MNAKRSRIALGAAVLGIALLRTAALADALAATSPPETRATAASPGSTAA